MAVSILKRKNLDMTQGTIWKLLLQFAIPIALGNLFQQLYTTVDSLVVGNFVGSEALAAVGATANMINALIGFFNGLSIGATVVIGQSFGSKNPQGIRNAVKAAMLLTFAISVLITVVGIFLSPTILRWANTPDNVMDEASAYLCIYFAGISGLLVYNMGTGILNAVGDSRRPLYFLLVSTATNIVLDLLFVLGFRMGVVGVALATILAQFLSAALVLLLLSRTTAEYRLEWKNWNWDSKLMSRIFMIGLPAGVQITLNAISNVFVQAAINQFGSDCMAGWSAYIKIDMIVLLPISSIGMAINTFTAQNLGARNWERMKKGVTTSLLLSVTVTMLLAIIVALFARPLVLLFNQEPGVVEYGAYFLLLLNPFYFLNCANQMYCGFLRGTGNTRATMIIMLSSFLIFRQAYLWITGALFSDLIWAALATPVGWIFCTLFSSVYYYSGRWKRFVSAQIAREEAA